MAKNKELATTKRRQAAALREAERRKMQSKKKAATVKTKKEKLAEIFQGAKEVALKMTDEQFPEEDYIFWLCQGTNYIVSDHEQAIWTPLFPEIYEGVLPQPEQIAERVVTKYSEYGKEWPLEGKAALGWTIQSREVVFVYYKESLRRLAARYPDGDVDILCKQPHEPAMWSLFSFLKDRLLPSKAKKVAHERHQ